MTTLLRLIAHAIAALCAQAALRLWPVAHLRAENARLAASLDDALRHNARLSRSADRHIREGLVLVAETELLERRNSWLEARRALVTTRCWLRHREPSHRTLSWRVVSR